MITINDEKEWTKVFKIYLYVSLILW